AAEPEPLRTARRCFEWVRDEIRHTYDYGLTQVTCRASEVLEAGTGICYAKSHLLAALLRANSIPAGFCYQRLSLDDRGERFCLHGLNALFVPEIGWYRVDARGNKPEVDAQFCPPVERLAFRITMDQEADLPEIWPDPLPVVIEALQSSPTCDRLWGRLPDILLVKNSLPDLPRS
ncbi:MAG TPA: transglutaminase family protein, partial [Blastocatellia bacterium]|nr:transglutaminase family protein [Blastocatellia bacterium]